jgi:glycosyltransferase involved in cell wall biosynthesis
VGESNSMVTRPKLIRVTTIPLSLNLLLKNQLKMLNQQFDVVALSSPGDELELVGMREGVRTIEVSMKREISLAHDLISLYKLIKVFHKERPTIVHANTPKGSLLSMIAAFICVVPIRIYTVTGLRYETEYGQKRNLLIWMERLTCKFASHVIAESGGVKAMINKDKLCSKKVEIIGNGNLNGIDNDFWSPGKVDPISLSALRQDYGISTIDFVYIFVGRLVTDKGVNELVRAFKFLDIKNSKLLLVGPLESDLDPLDEDVLLEIQSNPNILTTGYQSDVRSLLSISDVLVLPSYREGFPNVLLQAGAMGLPVISTDVNGSLDIIVDGKNGKIIEKRNVLALREAMRFMHDNYENFDSKYCIEQAINRFSQKNYYPLLVNFYKKLLGCI